MKATHKTALQSVLLLCKRTSATNYLHEKKELFSLKKIFFFMKRNNYFHEKKSAMTLLDRKNKDKLQERTSAST